jgi:hypothetical protein
MAREPDEPNEWCVLEMYADRARWLPKLSTASDAELEYLAIGKLPSSTDDTQ